MFCSLRIWIRVFFRIPVAEKSRILWIRIRNTALNPRNCSILDNTPESDLIPATSVTKLLSKTLILKATCGQATQNFKQKFA